jgi:hypothetical protein
VREDFPAQLLDFLLRFVCGVRSGIVVQKYHLISIDQCWALPKQSLSNPVQLFSVQVGIDNLAGLQQLKVGHSFGSPPDTQQHLSLVHALFGGWLGRFPRT